MSYCLTGTYALPFRTWLYFAEPCRTGMYRLSAYYAARTVSDLPIELVYPTLFVIVIYWFGGLRASAGEERDSVG